jgi:hypothetical protein
MATQRRQPMNQGDDMRDPRNQRDGANDQDRHGRKQNTGSNQPRSAAGNAVRDVPGGAPHGGGSGRDRAGHDS